VREAEVRSPSNTALTTPSNNAITLTRRAGIIDFEAIRDDGADIRTSIGWNSAADLIGQWRWEATNFRSDRLSGQRRRLLVMVEAAAMKPQIEAAVTDFGVPVIASGGFDSLTAKYDLARALGNFDGITEVLHIGDHDPSGAHLFMSMAEDVEELIHDLHLPGDADFTRLAVTPEQINDLRLPTAPPKATDPRAFAGETVQAEALPPDVLAQIVRDAIIDRLDQRVLREVLRREERCQKWLTRLLDGIDLEGAP
jgi:hypothetical protein